MCDVVKTSYLRQNTNSKIKLLGELLEMGSLEGPS